MLYEWCLYYSGATQSPDITTPLCLLIPNEISTSRNALKTTPVENLRLCYFNISWRQHCSHTTPNQNKTDILSTTSLIKLFQSAKTLLSERIVKLVFALKVLGTSNRFFSKNPFKIKKAKLNPTILWMSYVTQIDSLF